MEGKRGEKRTCSRGNITRSKVYIYNENENVGVRAEARDVDQREKREGGRRKVGSEVGESEGFVVCTEIPPIVD